MSYILATQSFPFFPLPAGNDAQEGSHWKISLDPNAEPHSWDDFLRNINTDDIANNRPLSIDFQNCDPGKENIIKLLNLIFSTLFHTMPDLEGLHFRVNGDIKHEPPQGCEGRRRFTPGMWQRHCQQKADNAAKARLANIAEQPPNIRLHR